MIPPDLGSRLDRPLSRHLFPALGPPPCFTHRDKLRPSCCFYLLPCRAGPSLPGTLLVIPCSGICTWGPSPRLLTPPWASRPATATPLLFRPPLRFTRPLAAWALSVHPPQLQDLPPGTAATPLQSTFEGCGPASAASPPTRPRALASLHSRGQALSQSQLALLLRGSSPPATPPVTPGSDFCPEGRLHTPSPRSGAARPPRAGLHTSRSVMPEGRPKSPAVATKASLLTSASRGSSAAPSLCSPSPHHTPRGTTRPVTGGGNLGTGWQGLLRADDGGVQSTLRVQPPS
ncbi:hypothetical protein NDU88_004348 [Pleurodeles waltl]|uniref:Uncharacterized protein n=1 Tax=Pleurodeles waltl TaxID=8319 RepID=A0AAV7RHW0_PLEWA|nr:hypothetical protein NDU88_004348 [Pleurodeles waltl]